MCKIIARIFNIKYDHFVTLNIMYDYIYQVGDCVRVLY